MTNPNKSFNTHDIHYEREQKTVSMNLNENQYENKNDFYDLFFDDK